MALLEELQRLQSNDRRVIRLSMRSSLWLWLPVGATSRMAVEDLLSQTASAPR